MRGRAVLRLAVFDLDGTLTWPGSSVLAHLGERFGFAPVARKLTAGYAAGLLTNAAVSHEAARELAGLRLYDLRRTLASLPMVDGIAETVRHLERHGVICAIATITFDFAARYVADRFGFHTVSATQLGLTAGGVITGEVATALEAEDKRCFVRHLCTELRITNQQALFVGDARSDIPAMRQVGYSVAFNATDAVKTVASAAIDDSSDLRDVLAVVHDALPRRD
jgi:phosphoserine phosphatase